MLSVDWRFHSCPNCMGTHPVIYKRTFTGKIQAKTACCGFKIGAFPFPDNLPRRERGKYLKWLNGRA